MNYPVPPNEKFRLLELKRLQLDQSHQKLALQKLCVVASKLIGTPIALISLVGDTEQRFAAKLGLDIDRTSREAAFCAHTIMTPEPLVVENSANDPRFARSPLVVGKPGIRAYAGIPLETSFGLRVGTLCAIDLKPRSFTAREIEILSDLGGIATSILSSCRVDARIAEDIMQAALIQEALLPDAVQLEHLKTTYPIEIASHFEASAGVGGDLWGLELVGAGRVLIYSADFAGHGLSAALNTVRLHSFIKSMPRQPTRPDVLLAELNSFLCGVLPTGQFATMFCAAIDFTTHTLEYASAAAPPQLLQAGKNKPFQIIQEPGLPLGVTRDATYESRTEPFAPGAILLLFSDALIETPAPPNSVFTASSLCNFVNKIPAEINPKTLCEHILSELISHAVEKIDDDLTLVAASHAIR